MKSWAKLIVDSKGISADFTRLFDFEHYRIIACPNCQDAELFKVECEKCGGEGVIEVSA